jgi:hypothetical protein
VAQFSVSDVAQFSMSLDTEQSVPRAQGGIRAEPQPLLQLSDERRIADLRCVARNDQIAEPIQLRSIRDQHQIHPRNRCRHCQ